MTTATQAPSLEVSSYISYKDVENATSPPAWISPNDTYLKGVPVFTSRPSAAKQRNVYRLDQCKVSDLTVTTEDHTADVVQDIFESMDAALLGVSVLAVIVVSLVLMIVVLRYMAHQKGTYHTHEEALTFKSDPDVQIVQDIQDFQEDWEED